MTQRLKDLFRKLLLPGAPAKIAHRLRMIAIARSVIRVNPLLNGFSYQLRFRRLPYGKKHTAIVIGAGGGIGEAVARQLLQQGCQVIGTYRNVAPKLPVGEQFSLYQLDITSVDQVCNVYEKMNLRGLRADLIVVATGLNTGQDYHASLAGATLSKQALARERDDLVNSFQCNTLGPYLVLRRFAGLMTTRADQHGIPQICVLSSSLGTMHNEIYGGMYGYRTGKGALHALAMAIYCDLNLDGRVGLQILGPGNVATKMNPGGLMPPEHAAREIVANLEYSARKATFQFLGVGGRRIVW